MIQIAERYGVDPQDLCPICFGIMETKWENNGFNSPEPTHYEITNSTCSTCGYTA